MFLGVKFANSTYTFCGRKVDSKVKSEFGKTLSKVILEAVRVRFTSIDDKLSAQTAGRWLTVCKNKKTGHPVIAVENM